MVSFTTQSGQQGSAEEDEEEEDGEHETTSKSQPSEFYPSAAPGVVIQ